MQRLTVGKGVAAQGPVARGCHEARIVHVNGQGVNKRRVAHLLRRVRLRFCFCGRYRHRMQSFGAEKVPVHHLEEFKEEDDDDEEEEKEEKEKEEEKGVSAISRKREKEKTIERERERERERESLRIEKRANKA